MEWGESYRGGVGHAVKQPKKNVSPQNQDLIQPKSFWKGYKIWVLNTKIIIIILLFQLYYILNYIKKFITRSSLYKNLDGMIIMLVPREKSRKVACVLNGTGMVSLKATTNKNMPSPTLSGKQLTIIFQKKRQNT